MTKNNVTQMGQVYLIFNNVSFKLDISDVMIFY
jgi:hypothetical protein